MDNRHSLNLIAAAVALIACPAPKADYLTDIGYGLLTAQSGATLTHGANIRIDQVEASQNSDPANPLYRADPSNADFSGVTFFDQTNGPNPAFSAHATGVATRFAGNQSMTDAVALVDSYEANDWIVKVLNCCTANPSDPLPPPVTGTGVLANHSWVGNAASGTNTLLYQRIDWLIEQTNFINVVAVASTSFNLFAPAYNVITVTATRAPQVGLTSATDPFYKAGRARTHVSASDCSTSDATPIVTSAVALLLDNAPSHTLRSEVVKALIMAGADKTTHNTVGCGNPATIGDITDFTTSGTSNGLDVRYGAGQLNIFQTYNLFAAGEKNSTEDGGSGTWASGYDYDAAFGGNNASNQTGTYQLGTRTQPGKLHASLVWNALLADNASTRNVFDPAATLYNLDLDLIDTTGGGATVIASSASTVDNTENLWVDLQSGHSYKLVVKNSNGSTFRWDYAIAWRTEDLPAEPPQPLPALPPIGLLLFGGSLAALGFSRR